MSCIITDFAEAVYQKMRSESMRKVKKGAKYPECVRIIGGLWRGRRIPVLSVAGLRPTPDRVRETLFNWLQLEIKGARVLDAFAGTGALGFESASRGAQSVTLIERDEQAFSQLVNIKKILACDQVKLIQGNALDILQNINQVFDIIFLDPPFLENHLYAAIEKIHQNQIIKNSGWIYIETGESLNLEKIPKQWQMKQSKKAGQVYYYLFRHEVF